MDLGALLATRRILVVDDNSINLKVAEGCLKRDGVIPTCVKTGKAAIDLLEPPHHFDACFMDLQMPEMDGYQATREIRGKECRYNERMELSQIENDTNANFVNWHTPILAMTADVTQTNDEQYLSHGFDGYILKPFHNEQMYRAMAIALSRGT